MQTPIPLLQNVRVASPCDASWEGMEAVEGERVKFCLHCAKNVYNLSEMTQSEAEGLLRRHEGRLCVRYYQRRDGTILTRDCPIGAQVVRMALIRRSSVAAGLFTLLFGAMAASLVQETSTTGDIAPTPKAIAGGISIHVDTPPVQPQPPVPLMGAVAPRAIMSESPRPKAEIEKVMGKVAIKPQHLRATAGQVKLIHTPRENNSVSAKDSTDEAILKPQ